MQSSTCFTIRQQSLPRLLINFSLRTTVSEFEVTFGPFELIFTPNSQKLFDILWKLEVRWGTWGLDRSECLIVVFDNTIRIFCCVPDVIFQSSKPPLIMAIAILSKFAHRLIVVHGHVIGVLIIRLSHLSWFEVLARNNSTGSKYVRIVSFIFAYHVRYFTLELIDVLHILNCVHVHIWI